MDCDSSEVQSGFSNDKSNYSITSQEKRLRQLQFGDAATEGLTNDGVCSKGKGIALHDVAEVFHRWTHALECIHKQALQLVSGWTTMA